MNKEDFELLGFWTEILPSGYMNLHNKQPFHYNGLRTIISYRGGQYVITTTHKTMDSLLKTIKELRTVEASSLRPAPVGKKNTKTTKGRTEDVLEPVTNQDLTAFLVSESTAPVKPKRTRKSKIVSG